MMNVVIVGYIQSAQIVQDIVMIVLHMIGKTF